MLAWRVCFLAADLNASQLFGRHSTGVAPADSSEALGGDRSSRAGFLLLCSVRLLQCSPPRLAGTGGVWTAPCCAGFWFHPVEERAESWTEWEGVADLCLMCVQKHQYARILISGFLLVAVGLLVTVVGFWFPLCSPKLEYKNCSFLPMQIVGPVAVVVGLGLFITGCIRRKQNFNEMEENQPLPEGLPNHSGPHHIIVGDSVVIFPTPPPAYFTEAPPLRTGNHGDISIGYESPPPYYSTFNQRVGTSLGEEESVYTIRVSRASIVGLPSHHSFFPELPPPYQKRESASQDQQAVCP
ncbi:transmembrane protein 171-like [Acipenser oxyrinchus oxyrinchus]|nr:transmembrane protein 171-like [Acipenser oxyrinchus oxyrinchus]